MTDAPSKDELTRLTLAAALLAVGALVFFVLPAEYGIDPTGFGTAIGLGQEEAGANVEAVNLQDEPPRNETVIVNLPASGAWREVKWDLEAGMTVVWSWNADFAVQYDLHSDVAGSFDAAEGDAWHGSFTAPEDGSYGWAFRTPTADATTITLHISGYWV
ncbi:MAG: hypothetical protein ACPHID_05005 [Thermoplasmatota archaeon]